MTSSATTCSYYIRREVRDMSSDDLSSFMDAFVTLSTVPKDEGVKQYGKHFRTINDFNAMHIRASAARNLDHVHDGLGQTTQYVAMTSEFELAIQSVAPNLAVPFWDFTIDHEEVTANYGDAAYKEIFDQSILFSDDVFGSTDDKSHSVISGYMGDVTVARDYNFTERSAYGFLRAPWNINPEEHVTRFHESCGIPVNTLNSEYNWPSCANHFEITNSDKYSSWFDWAWEVSYGSSGSVNAWTGGTGGQCEHWDELAEFMPSSSSEVDLQTPYVPAAPAAGDAVSETVGQEGVLSAVGEVAGSASEMTNADYVIVALKTNAFKMLKFAWRTGAIELPETCSSDTPVSECMWTCSTNMTAKWAVVREFVDFDTATTGAEEEYTDEMKEHIVSAVMCDTPFWPGDAHEAAAPVEASFWTTHGTVERLLQYKDIVRPFEDKSWYVGGTTIHGT